MKHALLRINENVGKQSQYAKVLVTILAWQRSKAQSGLWIVQNDSVIAETLTRRTRG